MAATLTSVNPAWLENSSRNMLMNSPPILITNGQAWNAGMFLKSVTGALKISSTSAATGVGADAIQYYSLETTVNPANATTTQVAGVVHPDDLWEINLSSAAASTIAGTVGIKYQLVVTSTTLNEAIAGDTHAVFNGVNPVWNERPYQDLSSDLQSRITVRVLSTAINAIGA